MSARDSHFAAALRCEVIITDGKGRPFEPPAQKINERNWEYWRRVYAWKDAIAAGAERAFAKRFNKAARQ